MSTEYRGESKIGEKESNILIYFKAVSTRHWKHALGHGIQECLLPLPPGP